MQRDGLERFLPKLQQLWSLKISAAWGVPCVLLTVGRHIDRGPTCQTLPDEPSF